MAPGSSVLILKETGVGNYGRIEIGSHIGRDPDVQAGHDPAQNFSGGGGLGVDDIDSPEAGIADMMVDVDQGLAVFQDGCHLFSGSPQTGAVKHDAASKSLSLQLGASWRRLVRGAAPPAAADTRPDPGKKRYDDGKGCSRTTDGILAHIPQGKTQADHRTDGVTIGVYVGGDDKAAGCFENFRPWISRSASISNPLDCLCLMTCRMRLVSLTPR